jgi:propanediol dehydratase small subunit
VREAATLYVERIPVVSASALCVIVSAPASFRVARATSVDELPISTFVREAATLYVERKKLKGDD